MRAPVVSARPGAPRLAAPASLFAAPARVVGVTARGGARQAIAATASPGTQRSSPAASPARRAPATWS